MTFKRDQILLEQANKLDADYMRAHVRDLEFQNDYLARVLRDLYESVLESDGLDAAMLNAAEALGLDE